MGHQVPTTDDPVIACSLDSERMQDRVAEWRSLRAALIAARSKPGHLTARYAGDEVFDRLRKLVAEEGECCPFLKFELQRDGGVTVMDLRYPPEAAGLIAFVTDDSGASEAVP